MGGDSDSTQRRRGAELSAEKKTFGFVKDFV